MSKKLPINVYVRFSDDDEPCLLAEATMGECIESVDTGEIAEIGQYKLVAPPRRYRKIIETREV